MTSVLTIKSLDHKLMFVRNGNAVYLYALIARYLKRNKACNYTMTGYM